MAAQVRSVQRSSRLNTCRGAAHSKCVSKTWNISPRFIVGDWFDAVTPQSRHTNNKINRKKVNPGSATAGGWVAGGVGVGVGWCKGGVGLGICCCWGVGVGDGLWGGRREGWWWWCGGCVVDSTNTQWYTSCGFAAADPTPSHTSDGT